MEIDPVCGMEVDSSVSAESSLFGDRTYFFCSKGCLLKFEENPREYVSKGASARATVQSDQELIQLRVEGMSASGCARNIEWALEQTDGVNSAKVDIHSGLASIVFDLSKTNAKALADVISKTGYRPKDAYAELFVKDMTCGGCAAAVQRALANTPGVRNAKVAFDTSKASVDYLPDMLNLQVIKKVIKQAGYRVDELK